MRDGTDNNAAPQPDTQKLSNSKVPIGVRIGGMAVRAIFIIILTVVTARVASPQVENIWSVFETPGDLIRVALGFAACVWFVAQVAQLACSTFWRRMSASCCYQASPFGGKLLEALLENERAVATLIA